MDYQYLFGHFIQDVIQVNTDRMRLLITGFAYSFGSLITTTDEDIDNFMCNTYSSKISRAEADRILIVYLSKGFHV